VPEAAAPAAVDSELMTPAEVRRALRIGQTTLSRWTRDGLITAVELPGGGRRYRRSMVDAILAGPPAPGAA
jgi:excisionase family DNA binding protein